LEEGQKVMKAITVAGIGVVCMSAIVAVAADDRQETTASGSKSGTQAVDVNGSLRLPDGFRTIYQLLGIWAVAADEGQGSRELHIVRASPGAIDAYRKDGRFPDGAVLVKEEFYTATMRTLAPSPRSHAETLKGWFVMVKDDNGRHAGNKLWGDGWGWSWFDAADPRKTTSTDYKTDCRWCHMPAQASDYIFVTGYLPLRADGSSK
jgi:Cytochrome P460